MAPSLGFTREVVCKRIYSEVKTEEGYSADIYPWRYMSAQHLTQELYAKIGASQGYYVLTDLNTSFALLSQLAIRHQF